jgi:hypothetical protein
VGGSFTISSCYAAGSVQAIHTRTANGTSYSFQTGGLIGLVDNTHIRDCYALGNVLAEKVGGSIPVYAGGLVGYVDVQQGQRTLDRCFSGGAVKARSSGSGALYAGGVTGINYSLSNHTVILKNCAALGASVTAMGPGTKNTGRVYGASAGSGTSASTDNYALDAMRIEKSGSAGTLYFPYWDGISAEPASHYTLSDSADPTAKDGASVAASIFMDKAFWTSASYLNFGADNKWDFSSVISRGCPKLKNVGGQ